MFRRVAFAVTDMKSGRHKTEKRQLHPLTVGQEMSFILKINSTPLFAESRVPGEKFPDNEEANIYQGTGARAGDRVWSRLLRCRLRRDHCNAWLHTERQQSDHARLACQRLQSQFSRLSGCWPHTAAICVWNQAFKFTAPLWDHNLWRQRLVRNI